MEAADPLQLGLALLPQAPKIAARIVDTHRQHAGPPSQVEYPRNPQCVFKIDLNAPGVEQSSQRQLAAANHQRESAEPEGSDFSTLPSIKVIAVGCHSTMRSGRSRMVCPTVLPTASTSGWLRMLPARGNPLKIEYIVIGDDLDQISLGQQQPFVVAVSLPAIRFRNKLLDVTVPVKPR